MLESAEHLTWTTAGAALVALAGAAFLASWVAGDVLRLGRVPYVAWLAAVTAVAGAVSIDLAGLPPSEVATHRWGAGITGGVLAGIVVGAGMRKLPATLRRTRRERRAAEVWEGGVYGVSEGVLLSGLPVLVTWQAAIAAGWGDVAAGTAALGASAAVIAAHHLGYWDFRGRHLVPAVAACGVLSLAYLVTGSVLAPAIGHVVMHVAGIEKGVELPPHARPPVSAGAGSAA